MITSKGNLNDEIHRLSKIYGPVYTSWTFSFPSVVITDLEFAKEAFVSKKNDIAGRPQLKMC